MTKEELRAWASDEFWPLYKKLCATPFVTKWKGGARGEAITKILQMNPSEELRARILSAIQAQIIHRNKLYEKCGSAQKYQQKTNYEKLYTNRDGRTWLHNNGWDDEIPSLSEDRKESPKEGIACQKCGELKEGKGKIFQNGDIILCNSCYPNTMSYRGMGYKLMIQLGYGKKNFSSPGEWYKACRTWCLDQGYTGKGSRYLEDLADTQEAWDKRKSEDN